MVLYRVLVNKYNEKSTKKKNCRDIQKKGKKQTEHFFKNGYSK
jgi:hypothetical protein